MIHDPQDLCLECGYSLEGLPRPYRCPECGVAFDDDTVVFRPRRLWKRFIPIVAGQLYLLFLGINHWAWLVARIGVLGTIISLVLLAAFVVVRSVAMIQSMIERPGFVALTKDGLVVQQQKQRQLTRIPYTQIAFVSVVDVQPWVQSKEYGVDDATKKETPRGAHLAGLFDGKAEMGEFKRMVTARMGSGTAGGNKALIDNGTPVASNEFGHVETGTEH